MILSENAEQRSQLAVAQNIDDYIRIVSDIKTRYLPFYEGREAWNLNEPSYNLSLPPWMCQPYVRPPPEEHLKKVQETQDKNNDVNIIFHNIFVIIAFLVNIMHIFNDNQVNYHEFLKAYYILCM